MSRSVYMRSLIRRFLPNGPEGARKVIERILEAKGKALSPALEHNAKMLAGLIVAALASPPEVSSFKGWAERNLKGENNEP